MVKKHKTLLIFMLFGLVIGTIVSQNFIVGLINAVITAPIMFGIYCLFKRSKNDDE